MTYQRKDELDPLPYTEEWPSLRSAFGRVDIHSLAAFWVSANKISGPYLEFGVASGRSAISAIRANTRYNRETVKNYFLFDSFEGLPKLEGVDKDSNQFKQGEFAFSEAEVIAKLKSHNVHDDSSVHMIKGYFKESLKKFDLNTYGYKKAAIVHIDVDLYESCREVLNHITPYVQIGMIILFDDWNAFQASESKGERRAAFEWLRKNARIKMTEYAKYGWHGAAFIINKV
jgi:O-methyltransferase